MVDPLYAMVPVAVIAGFITAISGGGGVLFMTSALYFGLSPLNALALNRITDIGVLAGCFNNFRKVPEIPKQSIKIMAPLFLFGAIWGASFAVSIPQDMLRGIIIVSSLIAISIVILQPRPKTQAKKKYIIMGYIAIALVGFWDGAIAMAGTTFFMIAAHYFFNMDYMKARVVNMFTAIPETLVSATILTAHSTVTLGAGLLMFVSAFVGAFIGSKVVIAKGHEFIRGGMIAVSLLMIAKLVIYDGLIAP